ncbi:NAD(P)H-binding protein [Kitasatospora sp. NPDC004669]|uniref:NAD(P)H-binding protein n=1 Tax=Kitasatospora sp. NPDC004669 TaxID=3154555 RepID=UPI0033AF6B05
MKTILVLGGTGTTGRRIAHRLTAAGHPVRTAARTGGDVRLDLADPATFAPALAGVDAVYLVEPDLRTGPDQRERIPRLVAEAVGAGVRRLVLLSAHGVGRAGEDHPLKAAERAVRESGVDWVVIQPGWFAQNFSESFWLPAVRSGILAVPVGDGRTPFVDAEDIAAVAAAALTEERHSGQTYQVTGPRALGFGEAAALISAAVGRTVRHLDVDPDVFAERMTAEGGVPAEVARRVTDLLVDIREGRGPEVSDGVERALGRPARSFEQFVTAAAAAGHWA